MKFAVVALLLLITSPQIDAKPKDYTTKDLLSPDVGEVVIGRPSKLRDTHRYQDGKLVAQIFSLGTTRQPKEILLLWNKTDDRFSLAGKRESLEGETFQKPTFFEVNQHRFLNISTEPSGSGGFVSDIVLWIAPDGTLHEVEFQQASEIYESIANSSEVVLTGGDKEFFLQDDEMAFQFWIAQHGDPHCCPSGGIVQGTYKLQGSPGFDSFSRNYKPDFKIVVDRMQHSPDAAPTDLHASN
jgi:hypothetical protein